MKLGSKTPWQQIPMSTTMHQLPCVRTCSLSRPPPRNVLTLSSLIAMPCRSLSPKRLQWRLRQTLPSKPSLSAATFPSPLRINSCGQGHQGGQNPGRGGRGFSSRGGHGGRSGRYRAARSTGACCAEDETPREPDHEESQPPDLNAYAEDQHAESYDDSFCAGVPEHQTPPGHYEACCDSTCEGPHPLDDSLLSLCCPLQAI